MTIEGRPWPGELARRPAAAWVDEICSRVVARLSPLEGIKALALGGSQARGTAREDSDVDLGLYYEPAEPFSIEALDEAACELDDRHATTLVTAPGAWGFGVNGGGWLRIDGHPVDLLYRDLRRVRAVVEQCVRGEVDAVYQLGHPLGFQNQIYAGELHVCRLLYDPAGELASLKQLVAAYPQPMRRVLVDKHLFDARFEVEIAAGPATRGDTVYVSQCLTRAAGFMVLVLYALNERFFLNEKNAFVESEGFRLRPRNFHREVARILGRPGNSPAELKRGVATMRAIVAELDVFCAGNYPTRSGGSKQPFARLKDKFGDSTHE
jgi:predicted nucleotidyltransferase